MRKSSIKLDDHEQKAYGIHQQMLNPSAKQSRESSSQRRFLVPDFSAKTYCASYSKATVSAATRASRKRDKVELDQTRTYDGTNYQSGPLDPRLRTATGSRFVFPPGKQHVMASKTSTDGLNMPSAAYGGDFLSTEDAMQSAIKFTSEGENNIGPIGSVRASRDMK